MEATKRSLVSATFFGGYRTSEAGGSHGYMNAMFCFILLMALLLVPVSSSSMLLRKSSLTNNEGCAGGAAPWYTYPNSSCMEGCVSVASNQSLVYLNVTILVHDSATPLKVLSLRGAEETLSEPQAMLYGNALPVG